MAPTIRLIQPSISFLTFSLVACTNSDKSPSHNEDTVIEDTSSHHDSGEYDSDTAEEDMEFGECGDGIINNPNEECDDGIDNANTADSCRTDCLLPQCGDGIQDSEEDCDDGNLFNVDGCSDECTIEEGSFEVEPNDDHTLALPVDSSGSIEGSLWEYDRDCYSFIFDHNDYFSLRVNPEQEECTHLVNLEVYEDGELVDTDIALDGSCTALEPEMDDLARFLPGSDITETTVCISGLLGAAVDHYSLEWDTFPDSCTLQDIELTAEEDPDEDLLANNCDSDDDNDGITDTFDNCPVTPNNGLIEYTPTNDGFIRNWIMTSAFQVSGITTTACQPLPDLLFLDETEVYPSLSNTLLDYNEDPVNWALYNSPTDRVDFLEISTLSIVAAPREIFAGIWVYSDSTRSVDVRFGPDDGGKVWVNGVMVGETDVCQGASADKYTYPTSLNSGWNRVLIQIRDNGGGWAFYFRFTENGIPVTDLLLSPIATGLFEDYQSDSDDDGIGDQCDLPD